VFRQYAGQVASSRLGRLEVQAVLRWKLLSGQLSAADVATIRAQIDADEAAGLWTWLPWDIALLDNLATKLRGMDYGGVLGSLDAIHLESALLGGINEIFSHDDQLKIAAPLFGLVANDVIP
jgi:hypothetical protein